METVCYIAFSSNRTLDTAVDVLYLVKSGLSVFHVRSISQRGVRQNGNEDVELSSIFSGENFFPMKRSMFILRLWKQTDSTKAMTR